MKSGSFTLLRLLAADWVGFSVVMWNSETFGKMFGEKRQTAQNRRKHVEKTHVAVAMIRKASTKESRDEIESNYCNINMIRKQKSTAFDVFIKARSLLWLNWLIIFFHVILLIFFHRSEDHESAEKPKNKLMIDIRSSGIDFDVNAIVIHELSNSDFHFRFSSSSPTHKLLINVNDFSIDFHSFHANNSFKINENRER